LRRFPKMELAPGPLVWRNNLGLRGLKSLPVHFHEWKPCIDEGQSARSRE
jgi:hypothetical protein